MPTLTAPDLVDLLIRLNAARQRLVDHRHSGVGLEAARTREYLRREVAAVEQQFVVLGVDPALIPQPAPTPRPALVLVHREADYRTFQVHLGNLDWQPDGDRRLVALVPVPSKHGVVARTLVLRRSFASQELHTGCSLQTITAEDGVRPEPFVAATGYEPTVFLHVNEDGTLAS